MDWPTATAARWGPCRPRTLGVLGGEVVVLRASWRSPGLTDTESEATVVVGEVEYSVVGDDLFESLGNLRRLLKAEDRLLCVEGARGDVFPAGMSRQMSGGQAGLPARAGSSTWSRGFRRYLRPDLLR
jgi:hypothetical protein